MQKVLVLKSDLPERYDVIDRASTGRSVATAIGSAVPFGGLLADMAASGVTRRGREEREIALAEKLTGRTPRSSFVEVLRAGLASQGIELELLGENRKPGSGEVLVRLHSQEWGVARQDKESSYETALLIRADFVTSTSRRSVRITCADARGSRRLVCPAETFSTPEELIAHPEETIDVLNRLSGGFAGSIADMIAEEASTASR